MSIGPYTSNVYINMYLVLYGFLLCVVCISSSLGMGLYPLGADRPHFITDNNIRDFIEVTDR